MKRQLLAILVIATLTVTSCKKDSSTPAEQPLNLAGTLWIGKPHKSLSGVWTYYNYLDFKSATDVDVYQSYLVGDSLDFYKGHLKYSIVPTSGKLQEIIVTGNGKSGEYVNSKLTYNKEKVEISWDLEDDTYLKLK